MKIIIERLLSNKAILFSSEFGEGIAAWEGSEPQCKEYEVEFDIEENLIWNQSIKKTCQIKPAILTDGNTSTLIGTLESVDEDGYSVLRMGHAIIPFCTQGDAFDVGSMLEIKVKKLTMFPNDFK